MLTLSLVSPIILSPSECCWYSGHLSRIRVLGLCKFLGSSWSKYLSLSLVVVQLLSHVPLFVTPWTAAHQPSLSFIVSQNLLKLMPIEPVIPTNHLILCRPVPLFYSVFPRIRVFSNESALCLRWPKYWSFSISPSNEYSGLISFRIDWFNLLTDQETLESVL